jgi:CDP-diacylglycerol--inositol 3-phosphatidyltransferase
LSPLTSLDLFSTFLFAAHETAEVNMGTASTLQGPRLPFTVQTMMAQENVFLFVPNLIGYVRILLAIGSFLVMVDRPYLTAFLYFWSGLLDAFDGYAARTLKQGTKLGATLDMLTDRCATTCLLVGLCLFYPKSLFVFQMLITLDITSHWLQMYSSLITGSSSHKDTEESAHYLLRIYYTSRVSPCEPVKGSVFK